MRRANLGNVFGRLLASGWINQLHAQTLSLRTNAKIGKVFQEIGKVFQETCQPPQGAIGHNHLSGALYVLRRLSPHMRLPHAGLSRFMVSVKILHPPSSSATYERH
jgi:hypothetical protein